MARGECFEGYKQILHTTLMYNNEFNLTESNKFDGEGGIDLVISTD
jgi:hypothetical protein